MLSNRFAFVLLAIACVSAAAGGGYLATKQNSVPVPAVAQSATAPDAPVAATPSAPPVAAPSAAPVERPAVQETEAVVGDSAPKSDRRPAEPVPARPTMARESRPVSQSARRQQAPPLQRTWPSSASQAPATAAQSPTSQEPPLAAADDRTVTEPARAPEPPRPTFEELVVSRDSVIGLQLETRISSETARIEDRVEARVTRDIRVGDRIAVPSGARVLGTVTQVERGGKFKEQARLGIRFNTIVLGNSERLPISTETIVRVGETPDSAKKIGGGAVGGAILGAILGGAKGAAIGATAGAGGGAAVVQAGDRSAVVLVPGTPLTARILSPVTVTIERQ